MKGLASEWVDKIELVQKVGMQQSESCIYGPQKSFCKINKMRVEGNFKLCLVRTT